MSTSTTSLIHNQPAILSEYIPKNPSYKVKVIHIKSKSHVTKGIISGLVTAAALGILFGPLAALAGFILGFSSGYLCSRLQILKLKSHSPSDLQITQPQGEIPDGLSVSQLEDRLKDLLLKLDEHREKRTLLHAQAVESRKHLQSVIHSGNRTQ